VQWTLPVHALAAEYRPVIFCTVNDEMKSLLLILCLSSTISVGKANVQVWSVERGFLILIF
jgi:hypothetical protein